MNDIKIREFTEEDRSYLRNFKLSDAQMEYTNLPVAVLDDALHDDDRRACVVVNDEGEVVGFFVLHKHYQHEGYDTPRDVVYVRSLSINESVQGKGYGTTVAMNLPLYVQDKFSSFDYLYLVVDTDNTAAWNLYERAGFIHTATKEDGPVGEERLYYLDLVRQYVSNLKLELDDSVAAPWLKVDLILDGETGVGYIEGEVDKEVLHIDEVFVEETYRNRGMASSGLRQLGTFLRRRVKEVRRLSVRISEDTSVNKLFEYAGFARFEDDSERELYLKYIQY